MLAINYSFITYFRRRPALAILIVLAQAWMVGATPAAAVPAFAQQTGQSCSACHVGAFGPQLKPYGRDFKLYGYQSSDGRSHVPPVAIMVQTSLTHTAADQSPPPAPHFGENDNFAADQTSLFYAGKAPLGFGAFIQATYDGVARSAYLDNSDVRLAKPVTLFGKDSVVALDFNNQPTVEDVWNSTPTWGFPYNASALAPGRAAATMLEGGLGHTAIGTGFYSLWDDTLYLSAYAYAPLERQFAGRLGEGENGASDRFTGVIPYWRVALLHDFGISQTAELGAYGLSARRYPGGNVSAGTDRLTDWAIDGTYQYFASPRSLISAHATYIHEDQDLAASSVLLGTNPKNRLSTARADISYSLDDTWTPSVQLFQTNGTSDPTLYGGGLRTLGYLMELAWTPLGKPNSVISWGNARLAIQYVGYEEFNGDRRRAGDNNTLYLSAWFIVAPLGWEVKR
jgi:hypothetical protein